MAWFMIYDGTKGGCRWVRLHSLNGNGTTIQHQRDLVIRSNANVYLVPAKSTCRGAIKDFSSKSLTGDFFNMSISCAFPPARFYPI